ncbi:hypothetical protein PHJA_001457600 [Phtheirospermum japonicum]|uniref:Uncharacterized protein n=1 Tax=Phtheirospermum japonicum TaxID=374723 RepID=A0A830CAV6_9LAMI|nr:hypothetical protein PHJA_001457600 [Phtheirospermum japonicum]
MAPSTPSAGRTLPTPPPPPPPTTHHSNQDRPFKIPLGRRPPNPHLFYSPPPSRLPSNPNPNYPQLAPRPPHPQDPSHFLYPVASSGRGFLSRPLPMPAGGPSPRPPFVFPYLDPGQGNPGFVRPNHLPHVLLGSGPGSSGNAGVMPGVVKGIPVSSSNHPKFVAVLVLKNELASFSYQSFRLRDRNRDDTLTAVRDRKVRITENASLYTLCRSWLRNGFPEETQPQYLDAVKTLPRPLPVAAQAVDSSDKVTEDREGEDEGVWRLVMTCHLSIGLCEGDIICLRPALNLADWFKDKESLEQLSEKELLQRHIKRAKRVRSR